MKLNRFFALHFFANDLYPILTKEKFSGQQLAITISHFCCVPILLTTFPPPPPPPTPNLSGTFNFETTPCKNHSDTNLVKIHLAVIEMLSFSCCVLFLVTAAILESQTAKKYNRFIQETFWHKDGSISTDGS